MGPLMIAFSYMDDIMKMQAIFGEVTEIIEREDMVRPNTLTKQLVGSDILLRNVHFSYKDMSLVG